MRRVPQPVTGALCPRFGADSTCLEQGYGRHREVRPEWLESLDLFLQYRRCLLFMPFQDVTARDPAWRRRWKEQIAREDGRLFGT